MRASLISFLSIGMLLLSGVSLGNYDEPGDNDQDAEPIENNTRDFTGGDGSLEHPFQISTVSQLQDMRDNLSAHYELINDINASETKDWNGYLGFEPIGMDTDGATEGFQGEPFNGSLNGNNHTISGIFINRSSLDYIGLFGNIMDSGSHSTVVKYLDIKEAYVAGTKCVGTLSGYSYGSSLMTAQYVKVRTLSLVLWRQEPICGTSGRWMTRADLLISQGIWVERMPDGIRQSSW